MKGCTCPAAEEILTATAPRKINCQLSRRMTPTAMLFDLSDCPDYTACDIWRYAKKKGRA